MNATGRPITGVDKHDQAIGRAPDRDASEASLLLVPDVVAGSEDELPVAQRHKDPGPEVTGLLFIALDEDPDHDVSVALEVRLEAREVHACERTSIGLRCAGTSPVGRSCGRARALA